MKTDGQAFLEQIAVTSTNRFEVRFSKIAKRLNLGAVLNAVELSCLYEAAFLAALCNIAFNGLGTYRGQIRPDREIVRVLLEREFMASRNRFLQCRGRHALTSAQQASIDRIFLNIKVDEANLA